MKTFDKEQIEQATNYFFQRIGKNNFEIKNISIQSGILEDNLPVSAIFTAILIYLIFS